MVGEQHVNQRTVAPEFGEFLHPPDVRGTLLVQVSRGGLAEHQGQRHLREQDRLQVRLGLDRIGQPCVDLRPAGVGDPVGLAIRSFARFGLAADHLAVAGQPAERGVNLPEGQLLASPEVGVIVTLQVVAVAWLSFEQAKQGQGDAHPREYTLDVYARQIAYKTVRDDCHHGPFWMNFTGRTGGGPAGSHNLVTTIELRLRAWPTVSCCPLVLVDQSGQNPPPLDSRCCQSRSRSLCSPAVADHAPLMPHLPLARKYPPDRLGFGKPATPTRASADGSTGQSRGPYPRPASRLFLCRRATAWYRSGGCSRPCGSSTMRRTSAKARPGRGSASMSRSRRA